MKTKKLLFYLLAAIMGGCIPSLHPLYTEKDLIFEEKLLGIWGKSDEYWKFQEATDSNSYDLTTMIDQDEGKFVAHLVKLDNMLFLDLSYLSSDHDLSRGLILLKINTAYS